MTKGRQNANLPSFCACNILLLLIYVGFSYVYLFLGMVANPRYDGFLGFLGCEIILVEAKNDADVQTVAEFSRHVLTWVLTTQTIRKVQQAGSFMRKYKRVETLFA